MNAGETSGDRLSELRVAIAGCSCRVAPAGVESRPGRGSIHGRLPAFADVHSRSTNLVLVCSRHHTLIHRLGFQLVLHPDRRLDVTTPHGTRLLHHPAQPWADPQQLDPAGDVSAGTLAPDSYDRLDLGYVVNVLLQQAA